MFVTADVNPFVAKKFEFTAVRPKNWIGDETVCNGDAPLITVLLIEMAFVLNEFVLESLKPSTSWLAMRAWLVVASAVSGTRTIIVGTDTLWVELVMKPKQQALIESVRFSPTAPRIAT